MRADVGDCKLGTDGAPVPCCGVAGPPGTRDGETTSLQALFWLRRPGRAQLVLNLLNEPAAEAAWGGAAQQRLHSGRSHLVTRGLWVTTLQGRGL